MTRSTATTKARPAASCSYGFGGRRRRSGWRGRFVGCAPSSVSSAPGPDRRLRRSNAHPAAAPAKRTVASPDRWSAGVGVRQARRPHSASAATVWSHRWSRSTWCAPAMLRLGNNGARLRTTSASRAFQGVFAADQGFLRPSWPRQSGADQHAKSSRPLRLRCRHRGRSVTTRPARTGARDLRRLDAADHLLMSRRPAAEVPEGRWSRSTAPPTPPPAWSSPRTSPAWSWESSPTTTRRPRAGEPSGPARRRATTMASA